MMYYTEITIPLYRYNTSKVDVTFKLADMALDLLFTYPVPVEGDWSKIPIWSMLLYYQKALEN